jgi:hypothetical protein
MSKMAARAPMSKTVGVGRPPAPAEIEAAVQEHRDAPEDAESHGQPDEALIYRF